MLLGILEDSSFECHKLSYSKHSKSLHVPEMLWTSVYNIVIPGQDNGDFVAPAASKTLAFYYFANGDYSLDKERWSLEMKFKQNLNIVIPCKFVVSNLLFWGQSCDFYFCLN